MKVLALVVAVLVLGACGSKAGSGDATGAVPPAPDTTVAPAPAPVDAKLPGLDTPAPAWYFPNPAAVSGLAGADQARQDALAQALGGPALVADDPMQSWTYTSGLASGGATSSGADPAAARAAAERVWQAAAFDLSSADVTVAPDGATVTAVELLDGVPSPLPFVVVVAPDGTTVVSASGHFGTANPAAPQDRIGTAAALSLLTSAPAGEDRGQEPLAPQADPPPAVAPLNPQPTTEPSPEATAVDRLLLPVTSVTETFAVVPADDGGMWLLPAYRFSFDDGSSRNVLAVAGPPGPPAAGSSPPPTTCAAAPDCGVGDFVGLSEEQAAAMAVSRGKAFRVAERDGVEQMLTADYSPDRVNIAVTAGAVSRAWYG